MLDRTSLNHHKKTLRKAFIIVLQLSKGREDTFILISLRRLHSYQLQSCNDRHKISFYRSKWIHIIGYMEFFDELFHFTYFDFLTLIVLFHNFSSNCIITYRFNINICLLLPLLRHIAFAYNLDLQEIEDEGHRHKVFPHK